METIITDFPTLSPMDLRFEEVYFPFILLAKKRYGPVEFWGWSSSRRHAVNRRLDKLMVDTPVKTTKKAADKRPRHHWVCAKPWLLHICKRDSRLSPYAKTVVSILDSTPSTYLRGVVQWGFTVLVNFDEHFLCGRPTKRSEFLCSLLNVAMLVFRDEAHKEIQGVFSS